MITQDQYVGPWASSPDWTDVRQANAHSLLFDCEGLEIRMRVDNIEFPNNPVTHSGVSGETYGGFRPQSCHIGAPHSQHKEGSAVDRYDPLGAIDDWIMAHQEIARAYGIYIEHPSVTPHWSHWSNVAPKSGRTVFYP